MNLYQLTTVLMLHFVQVALWAYFVCAAWKQPLTLSPVTSKNLPPGNKARTKAASKSQLLLSFRHCKLLTSVPTTEAVVKNFFKSLPRGLHVQKPEWVRTQNVRPETPSFKFLGAFVFVIQPDLPCTAITGIRWRKTPQTPRGRYGIHMAKKWKSHKLNPVQSIWNWGPWPALELSCESPPTHLSFQKRWQ